MDLIGALTSQLGVDTSAAQAVAGAVLGPVRDGLGGSDASALDRAVPELEGWQAKAAEVTAEPSSGLGGLLGGSGGLLGSALGAVAGQGAKDAAALAGVLGALGLDASKASLAAPLLLGFLKERLPADLLDKALALAPLLGGDEQAPSGEPVASVLSGWLSR